MSPESFCYWLKGWFELNEAQGLDKFVISVEASDTIRRHLELVFTNVTKLPLLPDMPPTIRIGTQWEDDYWEEERLKTSKRQIDSETRYC